MLQSVPQYVHPEIGLHGFRDGRIFGRKTRGWTIVSRMVLHLEAQASPDGEIGPASLTLLLDVGGLS